MLDLIDAEKQRDLSLLIGVGESIDLQDKFVGLQDDGGNPGNVTIETWLEWYTIVHPKKTTTLHPYDEREGHYTTCESAPLNFRKVKIRLSETLYRNVNSSSEFTHFKQRIEAGHNLPAGTTAETYFRAKDGDITNGIEQYKLIPAATIIPTPPLQPPQANPVTGKVVITSLEQFNNYFHRYSSNPSKEPNHFTILRPGFTQSDIPAGFIVSTATFHQLVLDSIFDNETLGSFWNLINDKLTPPQTATSPALFTNKQGEPMVRPYPNHFTGLLQIKPFDVITYQGGGGGHGGGYGSQLHWINPEVTYQEPAQNTLLAGEINPSTGKTYRKAIPLYINTVMTLNVDIVDKDKNLIINLVHNKSLTESQVPGIFVTYWDGTDKDGKYYDGKAYIQVNAWNQRGSTSTSGYLCDVIPKGGLFTAGFFSGIGKLIGKYWFIPAGMLGITGVLYAIPGTRHLITGTEKEEIIVSPEKKSGKGKIIEEVYEE